MSEVCRVASVQVAPHRVSPSALFFVVQVLGDSPAGGGVDSSVNAVRRRLYLDAAAAAALSDDAEAERRFSAALATFLHLDAFAAAATG
jgi:hypothetical protein